MGVPQVVGFGRGGTYRTLVWRRLICEEEFNTNVCVYRHDETRRTVEKNISLLLIQEHGRGTCD